MKRPPHPLMGGTARTWCRLLRQHADDRLRWGHALKISTAIAALTPLRLYESLRWHRAVAKVEVNGPVFVLGHWQSGHTPAQMLLTCDPRFATLRLRKAVLPAACLTMQRAFQWYMGPRLPADRICDTLPTGLDAPQGDDLPLGLLTELSFYHAYYFPGDADRVFQQSVLLEGLSASTLTEWKRQYRRLLQKILWRSDCERVVDRNATNTARIPELLEMFPDARFVFCHRNPYEVFAASLERWGKLTAAFSLQRTGLIPEEIEEYTLQWYERLLRKYMTDRAAIPSNQLIEIGFRDLEDRPLETMEQVYNTLELGEFATARPLMQQYMDQRRGELAGGCPLTSYHRETVSQRWKFAFDEWGYARDAS